MKRRLPIIFPRGGNWGHLRASARFPAAATPAALQGCRAHVPNGNGTVTDASRRLVRAVPLFSILIVASPAHPVVLLLAVLLVDDAVSLKFRSSRVRFRLVFP